MSSKIRTSELSPRKIFIGGLAHSTTEKQVHEYFSRFGQIEGKELFVSRGFGYVTFASPPAAEACVAAAAHSVNGKLVEVKKSYPARDANLPPPKKGSSSHERMGGSEWGKGLSSTKGSWGSQKGGKKSESTSLSTQAVTTPGANVGATLKPTTVVAGQDGKLSNSATDSRCKELCDMGFSLRQVQRVLAQCGWDVNMALDKLLIEGVEETVDTKDDPPLPAPTKKGMENISTASGSMEDEEDARARSKGGANGKSVSTADSKGSAKKGKGKTVKASEPVSETVSSRQNGRPQAGSGRSQNPDGWAKGAAAESSMGNTPISSSQPFASEEGAVKESVEANATGKTRSDEVLSGWDTLMTSVSQNAANQQPGSPKPTQPVERTENGIVSEPQQLGNMGQSNNMMQQSATKPSLGGYQAQQPAYQPVSQGYGSQYQQPQPAQQQQQFGGYQQQQQQQPGYGQQPYYHNGGYQQPGQPAQHQQQQVQQQQQQMNGASAGPAPDASQEKVIIQPTQPYNPEIQFPQTNQTQQFLKINDDLNQQIEVILYNSGNSGWSFGKCMATGNQGWFPTSCASFDVVTSMYAFDTRPETTRQYIQFRAGQRIVVQKRHECGWWIGSVVENDQHGNLGNKGYFPGNHCQESVPTN